MKSSGRESDYIELSAKGGQVVLGIKVQPRSARNKLAGGMGGLLKIKLTDPPVEGKANRGLIKLLSDIFRIPKRAVVILSGERGRRKTIRLEGISPGRTRAIIRDLLPKTTVKIK